MSGNERDTPAIGIRGLTVRFNGRTAIDSVDLDVHPRDITVVVGPSGSGKTTLLRAVNRLNECFPACRTEGRIEVEIGGRRIDVHGRGVSLPELRRQAAMVFQTPNPLPASVAGNFRIPLSAVGLPKAGWRDRMEAALREVGLIDEVKDRLESSALDLSGGQQQRLCLARALALEPSILLLDEPTANLDYRSARMIEDLLQRLRKLYTILVVSHSLGQTHRIAGRAVVLRDGRVVRHIDAAGLADPSQLGALVDEVF